MLLNGKVVDMGEDGFTIFVPCNPLNATELMNSSDDVTVEFEDGRRISAKQRRKAYILLKCIAEAQGYTPLEVTKELTKYMFYGTGYTTKDEMFSLSDCSKTEARLYISFLIDFCLLWDIPCGEPLYKLAEDLERYTWSCIARKKCVCCGKPSDLHHCDSIGAGRSRKEICHIGMKVLPLCREHHQLAHSMGKDSFLKEYHVEPIELTSELADIIGMTKKQRGLK